MDGMEYWEGCGSRDELYFAAEEVGDATECAQAMIDACRSISKAQVRLRELVDDVVAGRPGTKGHREVPAIIREAVYSLKDAEVWAAAVVYGDECRDEAQERRGEKGGAPQWVT